MRKVIGLMAVFLLLMSVAALAELPKEEYPGKSFIEKMFADQAERAKEYAPKVVTLPNGVKVQRTPDKTFRVFTITPVSPFHIITII